MGVFDLNKVAICMGRMMQALPDLEAKGTNFFSISDNKEEFYALAYMARCGILDRIEENSFMRNGSLTISIPMGLFKIKKLTMEDALEATIGKLIELSEEHNGVNYAVLDILKRGKSFYEFESTLPIEVINKLKK